jgi:hypothetical protein
VYTTHKAFLNIELTCIWFGGFSLPVSFGLGTTRRATESGGAADGDAGGDGIVYGIWITAAHEGEGLLANDDAGERRASLIEFGREQCCFYMRKHRSL